MTETTAEDIYDFPLCTDNEPVLEVEEEDDTEIVYFLDDVKVTVVGDLRTYVRLHVRLTHRDGSVIWVPIFSRIHQDPHEHPWFYVQEFLDPSQFIVHENHYIIVPPAESHDFYDVIYRYINTHDYYNRHTQGDIAWARIDHLAYYAHDEWFRMQ